MREDHLLPISKKESLLPTPNSRQILRIAINLKELIDTVIPVEFDESLIVSNKSRIINTNVITLARQACGGDISNPSSISKYQAVLIFCLLKVRNWYLSLGDSQLHDYNLYVLRATACQQLCKYIIEEEEDSGEYDYLLINMLCRRYVINENDVDQEPLSALELASDTHALVVIGSSGFQRCQKFLWRGWIIQNRQDPMQYVLAHDFITNTKFWAHFNPERLKCPMYQNALQLFFSVIYLILYTIMVNSKNSSAVQPIDFVEGAFYTFTIGFIFEEMVKWYHVGSYYLNFWNIFNNSTYVLVIISMIVRCISINHLFNIHDPRAIDTLSYRILACASPMIWSRIIFFLDAEKFMGTMLIVVKQMMKESLIFFVLLIFIMIGFLQGLLALDSADGSSDITGPIVGNLLLTILGESSFKMFEEFAYPYSAILYYSYCFIIAVILLNILIALYSSAYQNIVDNATDEYLALMVQKTLRYMRAPDENVYIAPLNLIELLLQPLAMMMKRLNKNDYMVKVMHHHVMTMLYFPVLIVVSIKEVKEAKRATYNRLKRLPPDANELDTPWDLEDGFVDEDADSVFTSNIRKGLKATNAKNRNTMQKQQLAEQEDPYFSVDQAWHENVKNSSQPVDKGCDSGVGWENYAIYEKVCSLKQE
ncbi:hypothetical protein ACO0RG_001047 [Hanseniaspora osmophila]